MRFDIFHMFWTFLREEDKNYTNYCRLYNICQQSVNSFAVLPNGNFCQIFGGMKSGDYTTTMCNTIGQMIMHAYNWIDNVCDSTEEFNFRRFQELYDREVIGDDSIVACDEISIEQAERSLSKFCAVTFSSDKKVQLLDAVYCAQNFKFVRGLIVPVPNTTRMICGLTVHKKGDRMQSIQVAAGIRIHSYYNEYIRKLCDRYKNHMYNYFSDSEKVMIDSYWLDDTKMTKLYTNNESLVSELLRGSSVKLFPFKCHGYCNGTTSKTSKNKEGSCKEVN
jgi:hypothetical protein